MGTDKINGRMPELDINVLLERAGMGPYTNDTLSEEFVLRIALKRALDERDAALANQPKWISVKERLPENDDLVLVRANGREREIRWEGAYALAMYGSEGWVLWDYEDDEVQYLKILHWMPLPEPPEEEHDV